MRAASFTKSTSAEIAKNSGSPMELCRNMESGARNGLAWNSIELTKACGTTFMHFPGLVPRHVWPILLRGLYKSALLKSLKRSCKGPCNATEIRVGRDWHRKNSPLDSRTLNPFFIEPAAPYPYPATSILQREWLDFEMASAPTPPRGCKPLFRAPG